MQFLRDVEADEAARKAGGGVPDEAPARTGGGQRGHPGASHHIKSSHTTVYHTKMCMWCGGTDMEPFSPINKLVTGPGPSVGRKDAYTARVIFGWCDTCMEVTDPAPHIVWGTWMGPEAMATTIQYKSNPLGRTSIRENLAVLYGFTASAGAVSNAVTAQARSPEGRVLPDSVAAFVRAKREAAAPNAALPVLAEPTLCLEDAESEPRAEPRAEPKAEPERMPAPPATNGTAAVPEYGEEPRRKTKKERDREDRRIPYGQTPHGVTDRYLTCHTASYPGSRALSFMEWCREWCTMAPYLGADESKVIAAGAWCHSIVLECARVAMLSVRPRKNTRTINRLFGGMRGCIVHDRIVTYNDFVGAHQECWVHLIRAFLWPAKRHGAGSPGYDRYLVIRALYRRARNLAGRIADALGVPANAAEMVDCRRRLQKVWGEFQPECGSIVKGVLALLEGLNGQEPAPYLEAIIPAP